jgi:DNA-binding transcriptional regulator YiaG
MVHVPELGKLWDAAHTGVKAIRELTCMTQAEFAARHLVPLRTLQRWEKGECPEHIRLFLLESEGMYKR